MSKFKTFLIIGLLVYSVFITGLDTWSNKVVDAVFNELNYCKTDNQRKVNKGCNVNRNLMYPETMNKFEKVLAYIMREL